MNLALARDIAIIILALLACIQLVVLLVVTFAVYRKVGPLLDAAKGAINNVQGTTAFIADTTVHPVIRVLSFITGVRKATETAAKLIKRRS